MWEKIKIKHLKTLDSLRGLAAINVFFAHIWSITRPYELNLKPWLFFCSGHESVILFFVLSGYVLTLAHNKKKESYFHYITRRALRIYPAYYLSMIFGVIAFLLIKPIKIAEYTAGFNSGFPSIILDKMTIINALLLVKHSGSPINGPTWSLSYEMLISVTLLPLLWKYHNHKNKIIIIIIILDIAFKFMRSKYANFNTLSDNFYYSIFFITGSLTFQYQEKLKILTKSIFIPIYLFIYANLFFCYGPKYLLNHIIISDILTGIGSAGIILLALNNLNIIKLLSLKIILFYGKISFSFYLLHINIMYVLIYLLHDLIPLSIIKVIIFIVTTIVSWIGYKYVELPFIAIGKKIAQNI